MEITKRSYFLIAFCIFIISFAKLIWLSAQNYASPSILLVFNGHYNIEAKNLFASIKQNAPPLLPQLVVCVSDQSSKEFAIENNLKWFAMDTIEATGTFNTKNMNQMMRRKLEAIVYLLKLNKDVLYVDTDIVFLADPLPYMRTNYDLNIQNDQCFPPYNGSNLCSGFMYIKSTSETIKLFKNAIATIINYKYKMCDQVTLNFLFKQQKLLKKEPVNIYMLDACKFPNGCRYFENSDKSCRPQDAIIVHNNYIQHDQKLGRFQKHNLLF